MYEEDDDLSKGNLGDVLGEGKVPFKHEAKIVCRVCWLGCSE